MSDAMGGTERFEGDVPPDGLAALHAELSSIRCEERPSFAPELEAELAREWQALQGRRRWPARHLMAAVVAGLVLVGAGVPSARAALVRFVEATLSHVVREEPGPGPAPASVPTSAREPDVLLSDDAGTQVGQGVVAWGRPEVVEGEGRRYDGPGAALPELLDRPQAERLIRGAYPVALQREGVGGTVQLLLWVSPSGAVDSVQVERTSGVPALDRAAAEVAPSLSFSAARRLGIPVGTWVRMGVQFEPTEGDG